MKYDGFENQETFELTQYLLQDRSTYEKLKELTKTLTPKQLAIFIEETNNKNLNAIIKSLQREKRISTSNIPYIEFWFYRLTEASNEINYLEVAQRFYLE